MPLYTEGEDLVSGVLLLRGVIDDAIGKGGCRRLRREQ